MSDAVAEMVAFRGFQTDTGHLLLYYITDRTQLTGDEIQRRTALLGCIQAVARAGVDYIQLREKDLSIRELFDLARAARAIIQKTGKQTLLLINSRVDVAIAAEADGVHLTSAEGELSASEVRSLWMKASDRTPVIGVSCHSLQEIAYAEAHGADFCVFGPIFEKHGLPHPLGVIELRRVCNRGAAPSSRMPVLALGGVTFENAAQCIEAGAAGIAGIRLFQEDAQSLAGQIEALRRLDPRRDPPVKHPYQT